MQQKKKKRRSAVYKNKKIKKKRVRREKKKDGSHKTSGKLKGLIRSQHLTLQPQKKVTNNNAPKNQMPNGAEKKEE